MTNEKQDVIPAVVPSAVRRAVQTGATVHQTPIQELHKNIPNQHKEDLPLTSSEVAFEIKGESSQFIELQLKPGQSITGEIGALMYFDSGIAMKMRISSAIETEKTGFAGIFGKLLGIGKV